MAMAPEGVGRDPIDVLADAARAGFTPTGAGGKKSHMFKRGLNKLTGIAGAAGVRIGSAAGAVGERAGGVLGGTGEAVINRMGQALEDRKAFGKSVANFALHGAATRGLGLGAKELAKGIVSYSGLAGAVGGGLTGTLVAGAFVGAVSGALIEYARQVNKNIDEKTDPSLAVKRTAFILKFKELRHGGVLKPSDTKKILMKGLWGGVAGAGAGALAEHTHILDFLKGNQFVSEVGEKIGNVAGGAWHGAGEIAGNAKDWAGTVPGVEGVKSIAGGAKDFAGTIPGVQGAENLAGEAKDLAGGAWHGAGEIAGNAKDWAGTVPGVEGVKSIAGGAKDFAGTIPGVQGAKDLAGLGDVHEAGHQAAEEAAQAITPEGFVPQADYNTLQDHFTAQTTDLNHANQTIADLQKQLADANQALAGNHEATAGLAAGATETAANAATEAAAHAQAALDHLGNSIPLPTGSNPWEVSTTILKQMGVNPTPEQIIQLDKVLCQENDLSVPEWGIKGTKDARKLLAFNPETGEGFKFNLTDTVKKAALAIATKK